MRTNTIITALSCLFFYAALVLPILSACAVAYHWNLPRGLSNLNPPQEGEYSDASTTSSVMTETNDQDYTQSQSNDHCGDAEEHGHEEYKGIYQKHHQTGMYNSTNGTFQSGLNNASSTPSAPLFVTVTDSMPSSMSLTDMSAAYDSSTINGTSPPNVSSTFADTTSSAVPSSPGIGYASDAMSPPITDDDSDAPSSPTTDDNVASPDLTTTSTPSTATSSLATDDSSVVPSSPAAGYSSAPASPSAVDDTPAAPSSSGGYPKRDVDEDTETLEDQDTDTGVSTISELGSNIVTVKAHGSVYYFPASLFSPTPPSEPTPSVSIDPEASGTGGLPLFTGASPSALREYSSTIPVDAPSASSETSEGGFLHEHSIRAFTAAWGEVTKTMAPILPRETAPASMSSESESAAGTTSANGKDSIPMRRSYVTLTAGLGTDADDNDTFIEDDSVEIDDDSEEDFDPSDDGNYEVNTENFGNF